MKDNDTVNPGASAHVDDTPAVFAGKGGKDLYLAHVLFTLNRWDWLLSNLTDSGDMRIVPFARSIVTKISDHDLKIKLLKAMSADIEKVRNWPDKPLADKNQKVLEVCQNAISVVYDHIIKTEFRNEVEVILPMCEKPPKEDIGDADSLPAPDPEL